MSDNSQQSNGWHAPENPGQWKEMSKPTQQTGRRFRIPTMPANLTRQPTNTGGWRLPQRIDTTARPAPSGPRPEDFAFEQTAPPEDETAATTDPLPTRPEDEAQAVEAEVTPRPEDEAQAVEIEEPSPEDAAADLGLAAADVAAAEAELDADEDDEAFSMNELMALQSLTEDPPAVDVEQGTAREVDITPLETQDADELMANLSPAERAALSIEEDASADQFDYAAQLRALQGVGEDTVEAEIEQTNAQPTIDSPDDEGAFDYNSRIRELQGDAAQDDLSYSSGQPAVEEDSDGSFDYADRIRQLQGDEAPNAMGETEALEQTSPLDPAQQELIQQFRQTEQQIRALRRQRDQGLITQAQLDEQLRDLMVLDNNDDWWMMGVDTEIWYRYDQGQGQWLVEEPPHTARPSSSSVPTDTGTLDPNEVIQGSLPQVGSVEVDSDYTRASDDIVDPYSQETDYVRPQEVTPQDPQATMVGEAAYRDQLPGSEATIANPAVTDVDEFGGDDYVSPDAVVAAPIDTSSTAVPTYESYEDYGDTVGKARERQQRSALTIALISAAVLLGAFLLLSALTIGGIVLAYNNIAEQWQDEIANLDLVDAAASFQNVYIYDATGEIIAELRSQEEDSGDRVYVPLSDVSPFAIHAIVSSENASFFQDAGYSPFGIGSAFVQNFLNQEIQRGASTITQQVVDNLILADFAFEDAGDEKIAEIVVAAELSDAVSKAEILEAYLNNIYFGNQQYGIQAAADFYFDKDAADLNAAESALLAGLIPAPAQFDPVSNPEAAFTRMKVVVDRMVDVGCLQIPNQAQAFCVTQDYIDNEVASQIALVEIDSYLPEDVEFEYPHFTIFVQERLQQQFSQDEIFQRGFRVYTTLVPDLQGTAMMAIESATQDLSLNAVQTGTAMVTDPRTGAIRAMVGSPDFYNEQIDGQVNLALTYQQPGSAIKPVTYAAALSGVPSQQGVEEYYTPASILWDVPTTYSDGTLIRNFDGNYRGPVTVRDALAQSLNVPAVKAYNFVGEQEFRRTAQDMGIRFQDGAFFGLPTGLGATEVRLYDMMEAYGTLSNNGQLQPLYAIERIEDFNGNPVEYNRLQPSPALPAQTAYLITDILSDDVARQPQFGVNNTLGGGFNEDTVAAKTGTTNDGRDLWTMGYTDRAVVGVWLGRVDNRETTGGITGYTGAAPYWRVIVEDVLQRYPPSPFQLPSGVVQNQYCSVTGTGTSPNVVCPGNVRTGLFAVDKPPPPASEGYVQQTQIDTWTRDLYDQNICPDNPQTIRVADISDGTAINWLNNNQAGQNLAQRLGLNVPVRQAPEVVCGAGDASILQAAITNPTQNETVTQLSVPILGTINAGSSFSSYDIQVAPAGSTNFQIVDGPFQQLPVSGQLGVWDTQNFQNGSYTVRLAINGNNGGFAYRETTFNLQKPLPTATPTVPPQPTAPPIIVPTNVITTPIPFEGPATIDTPPQDFNAQPLNIPTATADFSP